MHILLIEDDTDAGAFLAKGLREAGYSVEQVMDGREALFRATEGQYDLIVTDRMLPHLDGLEILRLLRQRGNSTPVLVMSALGSVDERVRGLREGGDDYLVKPFAISEFVARVEALLRRGRGLDARSLLRVGDLEMDLLRRRVARAGREIKLTRREFDLLEFLMRRPGQVATRSMLLEAVWDLNFDPQTNLIDVHISRLRQAVDRDFERPLIRTIRGSGYTICDETQAA